MPQNTDAEIVELDVELRPGLKTKITLHVDAALLDGPAVCTLAEVVAAWSDTLTKKES